MLRAGLALAALLFFAAEAAADDPASDVENLTIFGSASVPGLDVPLDRIPQNIQLLDDEALDRSGALTAADALGRAAGGVHVGGTQGSTFAPDVFFRGFESSALLGVPQGLSVFVDGVRANELLGDVVNWDLLPEEAIGSIAIVPGSNPLYGRNTLGGALAIETKRGFTHPGSEIEVSGGSFGRWQTTAQTGGSRGRFDYFAMANVFREDGFRDFSKNEVNQLFTELGWRDGETDARLTYTAVHDELRGNAGAPESFLDMDRSAVYTQPDIFRPDLHFVHIAVAHRLASDLDLDGDFFFRDLSTRQSNADAAEDESAEAGATLPGVLRFTRTNQTRYGGRASASWRQRPFGGENSFSVGVDVDHGSADLTLAEQSGFLDARRTVIPTADREPRTDVETHGTAVGLYAVDTYTPLPWLSLTPSVRYDRTTVSIDDRLGGRANGDHAFDRVDPGIGATLRPSERLGFFADYAESFRAPTAIELTCASESAPCPLPIAFVEDPPLDEVRARTFEVGMRGEPLAATHLRVAAFRTDLRDDILFVSSTRSRGFFATPAKRDGKVSSC